MRRTGVPGTWRNTKGSASRRWRGSGRRSRSSRIAPRRSSSRKIRCSSTKSETSSGCTRIRPIARWCFARTRRVRFRRWIGRRRCCRCAWACPPDARTTSLFAALDVKAGTVIGSCHVRHRAQEFRGFLTCIDAAVPADLDVHLILDNYATRKNPAIHRWLLRQSRFHLHFTPTSASWLNLVERWFVELTRKQIKRGTHRNTKALRDAITTYIALGNEAPRPFVWSKTA